MAGEAYLRTELRFFCLNVYLFKETRKKKRRKETYFYTIFDKKICIYSRYQKKLRSFSRFFFNLDIKFG